MSMKYVRRYYNVPAKRGVRVTVDGKPGVITRGDGAHLRIRLDGERRTVLAHPRWRVTYLGQDGEVLLETGD